MKPLRNRDMIFWDIIILGTLMLGSVVAFLLATGPEQHAIFISDYYELNGWMIPLGCGLIWIAITLAFIAKGLNKAAVISSSLFLCVLVFFQGELKIWATKGLSPEETVYSFNMQSLGPTDVWLNGRKVGTTPFTMTGTEMKKIMAISPDFETKGWKEIDIKLPQGAQANRSSSESHPVWVRLTQHKEVRTIQHFWCREYYDAENCKRFIAVSIRGYQLLSRNTNKAHLGRFAKDMVYYAPLNDYHVSDDWVYRLLQSPAHSAWLTLLYRTCPGPKLKPLFANALLQSKGLQHTDSLNTFIRAYHQNEFGGYLGNMGRSRIYVADDIGYLCDEARDTSTLLTKMRTAFETPGRLKFNDYGFERHEDISLRIYRNMLPLVSDQIRIAAENDPKIQAQVEELALAIIKRNKDSLFLNAVNLPSKTLEEYYWRRFLASEKWTWSKDPRTPDGMDIADFTDLRRRHSLYDLRNFVLNKWWLLLVRMGTPRSEALSKAARSDIFAASTYLLELSSTDSQAMYQSHLIAKSLFLHMGTEAAPLANEFLPLFGKKLLETEPGTLRVEMYEFLRSVGHLINHERLFPVIDGYMASDEPYPSYYFLESFRFFEREERIELLEKVRERAEMLDDSKKKRSWNEAVLNQLAMCGVPSAIDEFVQNRQNSQPENIQERLLPTDSYEDMEEFNPFIPKQFYDETLLSLKNSSDPLQQLILLEYFSKARSPENLAMLNDMLKAELPPEVKKKALEAKASFEHLKNNMPELPFKENNETGDMTK
ncbi:hypothetical protein BVX99_01005 [bacterium F16]|nr:hypothetical protein BVX99_01005 [bacterium F16]